MKLGCSAPLVNPPDSVRALLLRRAEALNGEPIGNDVAPGISVAVCAKLSTLTK